MIRQNNNHSSMSGDSVGSKHSDSVKVSPTVREVAWGKIWVSFLFFKESSKCTWFWFNERSHPPRVPSIGKAISNFHKKLLVVTPFSQWWQHTPACQGTPDGEIPKHPGYHEPYLLDSRWLHSTSKRHLQDLKSANSGRNYPFCVCPIFCLVKQDVILVPKAHPPPPPKKNNNFQW